MTAATSKVKKSFFARRLKNNFTEQGKLIVVNLVLQLIGMPLALALSFYQEYQIECYGYRYAYDSDFDGIIAVAVIAFVISLTSGVLFGARAFKYLSDKPLADMNYSLPLTSRQRFIADYVSGLIGYAVPVIISGILSLIIIAIGSNFLDVSYFWENISCFIKASLIVLIGIIMYYSFSVLTAVCCGSKFESHFNTFVLMIIVPVSIACVNGVIANSAGNGVTIESLLRKPVFTTTSPAGMAAYLAEYITSLDYNGSFSANNYAHWLVQALIINIALPVFTYFLYKRRKVESVSQPYVYKGFYHVILALCVFCILSNFVSNDTEIATGIFICAIFYFIFEVVSKRGFKRFWMSVIKFAATVTAVFVFCGICDATKGFGIGDYVPKASSVEYVSLNISAYKYNEFYVCDSFEDENVIKETTKLHEEILEHYDEDECDGYIDITYNLKNGSCVSREYFFKAEDIELLYEAIMASDEYDDRL